MNSKAKGEISEAVVIAHLVKLGHPVLLPFGNNQRYDLVFEDVGKLIKAQIKTARKYKDGIQFEACSTNGFTGRKTPYTGQVDVFLVYDPISESVYKVPVEGSPKRIISLRSKAPGKGWSNRSEIRWAKDFQI